MKIDKETLKHRNKKPTSRGASLTWKQEKDNLKSFAVNVLVGEDFSLLSHYLGATADEAIETCKRVYE